MNEMSFMPELLPGEFFGCVRGRNGFTLRIASMADEKTAPQVSTDQPQPAQKADLSSYCPNCGSKMRDSRCKMVCKTCGFFLSCSDFY